MNNDTNNPELSPLIVTSPHSGRFYPRFFLDNLDTDLDICKSIEDMFVDELIEDLKSLNISIHKAFISRSVLDLNRKLKELDLKLVDGELPFEVENSKYVKSGIGLIPINCPGGKIEFKNKIKNNEVSYLINEYYKPWHLHLNRMIQSRLERFGRAFILDCHSMPSKNFFENEDLSLPDFILGDCYGSSCNKNNINFLKDFLVNNNYSVDINYPYAGGYITKNYHNHKLNIETLQIEIRRDLYMNEINFEKNRGFSKIKDILTEMITHLNMLILSECNVQNVNAAQ